jgi:superfamily II DNA or RNA helicase
MHPGIYESLLTLTLRKEIDALNQDQFYIGMEAIDKAEAADILAQYVSRILKIGLSTIKGANAVEEQISFCNEILELVGQRFGLDAFSEDLIETEGMILNAILSLKGRSDDQMVAALSRMVPESGMRTSNLFTGSNADISLDGEIRKDILSADKMLWIVSFIRFSGIRIFENELREFTARENVQFQVITTSYMGATEPRAVEFLSALPNTEVRISYRTDIERLHAKAYLFERANDMDTAYIGSSNISRSALTTGLEWNMRVTAQENLHILSKARATFESHWNSKEFEDFKIGGIERLQTSISREKRRGTPQYSLPVNFDIRPYPFQKEILEKLSAERKIHGRMRNLVVAATGTGKTIIAALDYKRFRAENGGKARLLVIAHRKEILEQSRSAFAAVLGSGYHDFGELLVGEYEPEKGYEHLFVSVQMLNSRKDFFSSERIGKDFYDYVVIDEAHHIAAASYRPIFELFEPKIFLGLTATPERMDGKSLLPDFCGKIAAEIRLEHALKRRLLSPFQYFCVEDKHGDLSAIRFKGQRYEKADLAKLYTGNHARAREVIKKVNHYLSNPLEAKGIGFCVTRDHARFMADQFNEAGIPSEYIVSGTDSGRREDRGRFRKEMQQGKINFLFVVDIFNEGIDIPEVDTVLFLRPTESLTIFLQQLGRGLRLHDSKECLTVLDFVAQAHQNYNFAEKFRALVGRSRKRLDWEMEHGFPHLPFGCTIRMEKEAERHILSNIRNAIFNRKKILKAVINWESTSSAELTFANFLDHFHLDIRQIYKIQSWSEFLQEAGKLQLSEDPRETQLLKNIKRFLHIDSLIYLDFVSDWLGSGILELDESKHPKNAQMANMLYFDLWQKSLSGNHLASREEALALPLSYPSFVAELKQLINFLKDQQTFVPQDPGLPFPSCLQLHSKYTRDQILAAFGKLTPEKYYSHQEGILNIAELNTEVLFVTLQKSDKDFSPSTLYDDYAINEDLFHWQSQNRTSPKSPTGQGYILQKSLERTILLFVREAKKDEFGFTMAYHFLGPVEYVKHKGSRPMNITWKLEQEMPAYLWDDGAKVAVG